MGKYRLPHEPVRGPWFGRVSPMITALAGGCLSVFRSMLALTRNGGGYPRNEEPDVEFNVPLRVEKKIDPPRWFRGFRVEKDNTTGFLFYGGEDLYLKCFIYLVDGELVLEEYDAGPPSGAKDAVLNRLRAYMHDLPGLKGLRGIRPVSARDLLFDSFWFTRRASLSAVGDDTVGTWYWTYNELMARPELIPDECWRPLDKKGPVIHPEVAEAEGWAGTEFSHRLEGVPLEGVKAPAMWNDISLEEQRKAIWAVFGPPAGPVHRRLAERANRAGKSYALGSEMARHAKQTFDHRADAVAYYMMMNSDECPMLDRPGLTSEFLRREKAKFDLRNIRVVPGPSQSLSSEEIHEELDVDPGSAVDLLVVRDQLKELVRYMDATREYFGRDESTVVRGTIGNLLAYVKKGLEKNDDHA